jgi:hypothetical protein
MAINNKWGYKSKFYEGIDIWGKKLAFIHHVDNSEFDNILVYRTSTKCPKCEALFNSVPYHGSEITCSKCKAQFQFFGALYPSPIGETRKEVERALKRS